MMKRALTLLALSFTGFAAFAQQDPQFTHNRDNKLFTNPGYAGTNQSLCVTTLYRQQWVSFPGAPSTGILAADMPIGSSNRMGVGLSVMYDKLGFDQTIGAKAAYSFHIPIASNMSRIGIGIEAGMLNKRLGGAWVATDAWQSDAAIPAQASSTTYDVGFGIFYSHPKMYFGLSSTHLPQQVLKDDNLEFEMARHYYVTGGYDWWIGGNDMSQLRPAVFVKSDASVTQVDLNVSYLHNKMLWAGVSYRLQDAIAPEVGFMTTVGKDNVLKIGYSYDLTTSDIKNHSSGSHEIFINFCKPLVKKTPVMIWESERFF